MKYLLLLLAALSFTACSHTSDAWRRPAAAPFADDDFQLDKDDEEFAALMSSFDLEDPKYILTLKTSSTSVGMKVALETVDAAGKKDTDKLGTWLPKNAAADPEAQVVSYYLGQFLHMGDYVVQSAYYPLGPKAIARFKALINCSKGGSMYKENCVAIKAQLDKNPSSFDGILRNHVSDEVEVPGMDDGSVANGTLKASHPIAKFLTSTGAMPSAEKKMDLGISFQVKDEAGKLTKIKPQDTELNLARQFSKIMVLDMLTGQWDRFSGGNIEAIYKKKKNVVQFIAQDNGGASMSGKGYEQYYKFMGRFDLDQIQRVEHLYNLLQSNPEEVKVALQMRTKIDSLKNRCKRILDHVKALEAKHGKDKVYFPPEA